ncbi:hypothetical protein POTOM_039740 [Populus tomentosa]|uniref:VQ domain-containing protein n=2 Tax=Populus TaxID=3689 RepID=A0A8X7YNX8_POPTO|nr:hypothetical protein POTOM_039740 [Populus tomentosa]
MNLPVTCMKTTGSLNGLVREPVKVVIINTEYVQTDASSFKSVVQKLTGKDSAPSGNRDELKMGSSRELESMDQVRAKRVRLDVDDNASYASGDPVLMRDFSFKEFEILLNEMPSVDELYQLFADI